MKLNWSDPGNTERPSTGRLIDLKIGFIRIGSKIDKENKNEI
jgi:hypothetical protein